ncbi:hypothetical protein AAFN87_14870 [Solibacillus sp. CAU 1738]
MIKLQRLPPKTQCADTSPLLADTGAATDIVSNDTSNNFDSFFFINTPPYCFIILILKLICEFVHVFIINDRFVVLIRQELLEENDKQLHLDVI